VFNTDRKLFTVKREELPLVKGEELPLVLRSKQTGSDSL